MAESDPRLIDKKLKELQARVQRLEANSLAFSAQQKGPLPGFVRAVRINDSNQAGAMWMNFTNAGPGLGPYSAVTDTNGVIRAEWGNLAANGISPAQFGFRQNDPTSAPAFDSTLGLIQALTVPASVFVGTSFTTASTTPVLITGTALTFTPAHQIRVVVLYAASVSYGPTNTQTAVIDLFQDNVNLSASGFGPAVELQYPLTQSGAVTSMGFYTTTLSPVSHTIDLRASQNGTQSMTVLQAALLVMALGVV